MMEERKAALRAKVTLDLPKVRETRGAVMYGLEDRAGLPFSNLYVRKDALRQEGVKGFPAKIRVTVEVLD
jgi:hypothetical protein